MSSVYLTGDVIENADLIGLPSEPDWRTHALSKLQRYGMRVVNPIVGPWAGSDEGLERRVRRALDLIDQCDAMLANLREPGYGTAMEIFYAHRRGKMVTVVGHSPFSPWVLSHSQARFQDIERAVDYIIGEHPEPDILNLSLQYESLLSEHYEQLPPAGELDYQFLGGDLPVLVLAPHATAFFRQGEFQEPDMFTGCMAATINRVARAHALLSTYCAAVDPLMHLETPFVKTLTDVSRSGKIGLVVMLLGSSWHEYPGLFLEGAGPAGALQEDYASRLRLKLSALEPVGISLNDEQQEPLIQFVSKVLSLPVLVLKMHRRYRMPRLQSEPFVQLVGLLSEFLAESGLELSRGLH